MEKRRQTEECKRKIGKEGWAGMVVAKYSGDTQVLPRNVAKNRAEPKLLQVRWEACGAQGALAVFLSVPSFL